MLQRGFADWNKKDFRAFINASALHGRNEYAAIANDVEGKSEEDIRSYAAVFWKRVNELPGA